MNGTAQGSPWLAPTRVVDLSDNLAGLYASRLLKDAGASVLRCSSVAAQVDLAVAGGSAAGARALLEILQKGDETAEDVTIRSALDDADIVLCGASTWSTFALERAVAERRALTVVSISEVGLDGPFSGQRLDSCLRQAMAGSLFWRGDPDQPPLIAAGEIEHFLAGAYAAAAAVAGLRRARLTGTGDAFDLSLLEVCNAGLTTFGATLASLWGRLGDDYPRRSVQVPAIERTKDGWVGLCVISAQQRQDLMHIVGRSDLADDASIAYAGADAPKTAELKVAVAAWAAEQTTDDVIDIAAAFRIPVAPIGRGSTLLYNEQLVARGFFGPDPHHEIAPGRTFRLHDPTTVTATRSPGRSQPRIDDGPLSLSGLRVVDLTAWWAGPSATHFLAAMGADVVKVESTPRPDGMRYSFVPDPTAPDWWDHGPVFFALNTNKRGITLDFTTERGLEVLQSLVERADVLIENFSPRVLDSLGLDWRRVRDVNPGLVVVRMPAFGLDGPWRDRTGFAQTIEQTSGLAWTTGHPNGAPIAPRGVCDPLAGMHAAFSCLAALEHRDRHGTAGVVEVAMLEPATFGSLGQILAWQHDGVEPTRMGNRHPQRCPRGVYPTSGDDRWIAVDVETTQDWVALAGVLGRPEWCEPPWTDEAHRRGRADLVDADLSRWTRAHTDDEAIGALTAAGIPCARVTGSGRVPEHAQFAHRGYFEWVDHPVAGRHPVPGLPLRSLRGPLRWNRTPAPTLGRDTAAVLREWLALSDTELADLEQHGITGTRPLNLDSEEPA
jgi:crotonobetainyl-CoA:carnitine CoA-transferase CaiB-like acyl-CoA transferase